MSVWDTSLTPADDVVGLHDVILADVHVYSSINLLVTVIRLAVIDDNNVGGTGPLQWRRLPVVRVRSSSSRTVRTATGCW